MAKAFQDTSIMQGVFEFEGPSGTEYRFVKEGEGIFGRYVKEGEAYVRYGTAHVRGKVTPRSLLKAA